MIRPQAFTLGLALSLAAAAASHAYVDLSHSPFEPRPEAQHGGCETDSWNIQPTAGPSIIVKQRTSGGAACVTDIQTDLPIANLRVVSFPAHGALTQAGPFRLVYEPDSGFRGEDRYVFQYCGKSREGTTGCATLDYAVTVR